MEFLFYTSVERLALLWNRESFLTKNDDILQQYKPHRWWSCRFNFHDKHWTAKTFSPFRLNVTCVSSHHFFGNNMSPRKKFGRNQYMYQLYARYHIDYKISARSFFFISSVDCCWTKILVIVYSDYHVAQALQKRERMQTFFPMKQER